MFEFLFKLNEQLFVIWNVAAAVSLQFISAALTSLVQSLIRVKGHRGDAWTGKCRKETNSVTRLGDLLNFGQLFKAFGNI